MCGIFGFMDHQTQRTPDEAKLHETAELLAHRGPDHQSVFSGPSVGLVHTRLSLVDLDPRSNQPFWDTTGRYALVFNGEIYNYPELRKGLEEKGVSFRTSGDTEVLLQCLIHEGFEKTLPKLEGMFAFAFYDRLEATFLLARDRIGMKPLYLYDDSSRLVFSSEIQPMRPWIPWKANAAMASSYLEGLHWVAEGHALFEGVTSVVPGSFISVKRGSRPVTGRFFALSDFWDCAEQERLARLTPAQAVDAVEEKLIASIRLQLRADAPLGAFCSGGVDSSLIAAIASKIQGGLTIFHSNIVGKCSEYEAAKALAGHLKAEFITKDVTDEDYLERIPDTMRYAEFPYRHLPTSTPFLMLSECARSRGIKGLLTGEASDEAFLGYPHYAPNLFKLIPELPKNTLRLLKNAVKGFPAQGPETPADFAGQFHQRFQTGIEKEDIYRALLKKANGRLKPEQLLSLYDFTDNIRALTHRNDSMGMAAGIETRFPFLDSEVIRTGINLPSQYKLRLSASTLDPAHPFIRDKWVVRKLADRYLPRKLSRRIKTPWPTTFLDRMQISSQFFEGGSVKEWLNLSEREIRYFVERAPQKLKTTLMYLEVWAHVCFYQNPKEDMVKKIRTHVKIRPETLAAPSKKAFFARPVSRRETVPSF